MSSLNDLLIELTLGELQTLLQVLDLFGQVFRSFSSWIPQYLDKTVEAIF